MYLVPLSTVMGTAYSNLIGDQGLENAAQENGHW